MKDFDAEAAKQRNDEDRWPVEQRQFRLGGKVLAHAEVAPMMAVIGLGVALKSDDQEVAATALSNAVLALLDPSCHDDFYRALEAVDPDTGLPLVRQEQIPDLYTWLMGAISKRPPTQRSDSQPSPESTGTSSMDGSDSAATRTPVGST